MKFIKQIFDALTGWLFTSNSARARLGEKGELYDIDTEVLQKRLSIDHEAKKLGEAGLPDTGASTPSAVEFKVIQKIDLARHDFVEWAVARLKLFNADINRLDVSEYVNRIRSSAADVEQRSSALIADYEAALRSLSDSARAAVIEYNEFRKRNEITRQPDFPSTSALVLRVMILALLVVVEGGFNAFFFAKGTWGGLLGGFLYAVLFALANVLVAALIAHLGIRSLFHSHIIRKVFGVFSTVAALLVAIGIGLIIAHYRTALASESEGISPNALAYQSLLAAPFSLGDIDSTFLFAISVVFAFGAVIDTIGMSDKFPGYARIFKKQDEAKLAYEEELAGLRDALEALKAETLTNIERSLDKAKTTVRELDERILAKQETEKRMNGALHNAARCQDSLVQRFRDENSLHRTTAAPAYFAESLAEKSIQLPTFDVVADRAKYAEQQLMIEKLNGDIESIRSEVQAAFTKQFDSFIPLSNHMQSHA